MSTRRDVVVVGAGPYGLSVAAHLRHHGFDITVLGHPMASWTTMPIGMNLKSKWGIASTLSEPTHRLTLARFTREQEASTEGPIPLTHFVAYGRWFQQHAVGELDANLVEEVDWNGDDFTLRLDDGRSLRARRVVLAPGINNFARMPAFASGLDRELVSHTGWHTDLRRFAGQRVLVVGAGQSALESAALLHESGAQAELLVRARRVAWILDRPWSRPPLRGFFYGPSDVGPPGLSRLVDFPRLMRHVPRARRARLGTRAIRPAGATWLRPRVHGVVKTTTGVSIVAVETGAASVRVRLSDGSTREIDHLLLGTGYVPSLERLPFISPRLTGAVRCEEGLPVLDTGFESSVRGLHFAGSIASGSFGPIFKFVAGVRVAAPAIAARIRIAAGQAAPLPRPAIARSTE
jgi:cation diffusion facilitator CzcD-associated flavoprotein CzcO